jgi:hypothetical protein
MVDKEQTMVDKNSINKLKQEIPDNIANLVRKTGKRSRNPELIRKAILDLCAWRDLSIAELAELLHRNEKYINTHYIQSLINEGEIAYTIPAMLTHPNQKYRTTHIPHSQQ